MENIEKFFKSLKHDCSEIIDFYKKHNVFLLSGRQRTENFFIKPEVINRKPVNIDPIFSETFDRALKDLGYTARRDNSIFCTGNQKIAKMYGKIYVVFPMNGFSFTWSNLFDDLYYFELLIKDKIKNEKRKKKVDESNIVELINEFGKKEKFILKKVDESNPYVINEILSDLFMSIGVSNINVYQYTDLDDILKKNTKVKKIFDLNSDFYENNGNKKEKLLRWIKKYFVPLKEAKKEPYEKRLYNYFMKIIPQYYSSDDLYAAIKSNNEIFLHSNLYYFVREEKIDEYEKLIF